ncbi:MAG: NUDIX domain-containing protein [Gemmatimonadetes bacterium]|nr:NUDIX domain-containing protein [Gemmatimonadota bacterium]
MAKSKAQRETSAGGVIFRRAEEGPQFLLILDGHGNWGFPKGHLEAREAPLAAAQREVAEECGLDDLIFRGDLDVIDWYFRTSRSLVHKYCHLFLFESPGAEARPQLDEGITRCCWYALDSALQTISYENSRHVLRKAGDLAQILCREEAPAPES